MIMDLDVRQYEVSRNHEVLNIMIKRYNDIYRVQMPNITPAFMPPHIL